MSNHSWVGNTDIHYSTFTKAEMMETLKTIERIVNINWDQFNTEANRLVGEDKYNQMIGKLRHRIDSINYVLGVNTNA